jgi:hypothetical protein
MRLLYTMVENANDWKSLTSTRDLSRWFLDDEMRFPSGTELADQAGEDIYTQFGWNVEPSSFPVLAHVEVATDYKGRPDRAFDRLKTKHIPAAGVATGLNGPALCGRWARYLTGDHAQIRRSAIANPEGYCKNCVKRMN